MCAHACVASSSGDNRGRKSLSASLLSLTRLYPKILFSFMKEALSAEGGRGTILTDLSPSPAKDPVPHHICSWRLGDPQEQILGWSRELQTGIWQKSHPLREQKILVYNPQFSGSNPIRRIQDANAAVNNRLKDNWGNLADRWEVLHLGKLPSELSCLDEKG